MSADIECPVQKEEDHDPLFPSLLWDIRQRVYRNFCLKRIR